MTKKTSYSFILALAVVSLLFFAPQGVFAATIVSQYTDDTTYTPPSVGTEYGVNICETRSTWQQYNSFAFHPVSGGDYYVFFRPYASSDCSGGTLSNDYVEVTGVTGGVTYTMNASTHSSGSVPNNIIIGTDRSTQWAGFHSVLYTVWRDTSVVSFGGHNNQQWFVASGDSIPDVTGIPPTTNITAITPQITDPFTQTATTTVSYYITAADLAAGTTTLSYVITTQDSIGYNPAQIGTIVATTSGSHTDTFYMGTGQAAWSAYYTLAGVAGEDPNIGAFYSIATSTFWVNGTSTLLNITTATSTGTTTNGLSLQQCKSTSLVDFSYFACVIGNRLSDVFQWLFIPPQGSLNQYQNMQTTLQTKVPFGYFFLIKNAISGVNASSTSTFTLTLDQGVLAGIITPIRTALSWILLMGFGFWFYMRMKHLDIW